MEEGFVEVDVPLLKDNLVQSLEFNSAGRITGYSTSGLVETWKLGLTSQVNDDIRLRTTWSFDIRAPDLQELYGVRLFRAGQRHRSAYRRECADLSISLLANPDLKPEQSTTVSGGVVLTPRWVEGLSLSADWYSIHINKAIATFEHQFRGVAMRGGRAALLRAVGLCRSRWRSLANQHPAHQRQYANRFPGVDFQGDYRSPSLPGPSICIDRQLYRPAIPDGAGSDDPYAGSIGPDFVGTRRSKIPRHRGGDLYGRPWQGTVQGRVIGAAVLNSAWGPLDVDDNSVPPVAYLDLRGAYRWTENIQLYAALDNVFNTPPPVVAATTISSTPYDASVRDDVYDAIGRQYRVGVRFNF